MTPTPWALWRIVRVEDIPDNSIQVVLGTIVKFGPRVGIIVGEIDHHLRGDCWLVRTPTTVIKDQMGDLVPKDSGVSLATYDELIEHCQQVIAETSDTLTNWTRTQA